jgi:hypothetical protein
MYTGIAFMFATAVFLAMVVAFIELYARYRGNRIVTCPETNAPAGAKINAALAAGTWLVTQPRFVATACSRWPERAGCDQACAPQVETSPEDTLVRNIVAKWYGERTCTYCAQPIRDIGRAGVTPALLGPNDELHQWNDIPAEDLPQVLSSPVAVCAPCELAEDFRRRFPDRVTERPATPLRSRGGPHVPRHVEPPSQAVY